MTRGRLPSCLLALRPKRGCPMYIWGVYGHKGGLGLLWAMPTMHGALPQLGSHSCTRQQTCMTEHMQERTKPGACGHCNGTADVAQLARTRRARMNYRGEVLGAQCPCPSQPIVPGLPAGTWLGEWLAGLGARRASMSCLARAACTNRVLGWHTSAGGSHIDGSSETFAPHLPTARRREEVSG